MYGGLLFGVSTIQSSVWQVLVQQCHILGCFPGPHGMSQYVPPRPVSPDPTQSVLLCPPAFLTPSDDDKLEFLTFSHEQMQVQWQQIQDFIQTKHPKFPPPSGPSWLVMMLEGYSEKQRSSSPHKRLRAGHKSPAAHPQLRGVHCMPTDTGVNRSIMISSYLRSQRSPSMHNRRSHNRYFLGRHSRACSSSDSDCSFSRGQSPWRPWTDRAHIPCRSHGPSQDSRSHSHPKQDRRWDYLPHSQERSRRRLWSPQSAPPSSPRHCR